MKLSYKIFAVYLIVTTLLLLAVFSIIRIYATKHFEAVEAIFEKETISVLIKSLALEYKKTGSWEHLGKNPGALDFFFRERLHKGPSGPPRNFIPQDRPKTPDFLPPDQAPPGPAGDRNMGLPHYRFALFTPDKKLISGPAAERPPEGYKGPEAPAPLPDKKTPMIYKPIRVDGNTVGWLGYYKIRPRPPMHDAFLKTRLKVFYTVGILLFLIAGLVAYLLSRHILSPVEKLARGTRALTRFEFDTRIQVDTTDELGQLASDFNQMAQTLERYETMRTQWMIDISHELRTPLTILRGEIEAMQDGIRQKTDEAISSLYMEVEFLDAMVNDLHLLALADTEALALKKETMAPVQVLASVLEIFKTRLESNRLRVDASLRDEQTKISGDAARLKRLFSNIIENNIKYTLKPGTIFVRSSVRNRMLQIEISDTGPGVPPGSLEKIFDRLYRVDSARQRTTGGSGLGLSICKAIAQAHDGDIEATHTEKGGLKITLRLPVNP